MFRNHWSNVVKNMYDKSYYHLTHNQLRRFENVCFLARPFYKLDISSLLEIFIFNFNFRSGHRLKYFVVVFCFSFMYVSTVLFLGTEVYLNRSFSLSIAQDIQNMSLNEMRRRSYKLKMAHKIKANLAFLKPVLQNAQQISKKKLKNAIF